MQDLISPDHSIIERAAEVALSMYANKGQVIPAAFMETAEGITIIPAESFNEHQDKIRFMNILRLVSIENNSIRMAFIFEGWSMESSDPADIKFAEELSRRGDSLENHPKAREAIYVLAESDAGTTLRKYGINRDGIRVNLVQEDETFDADGALSTGVIKGFHVRTIYRDHPKVRDFVKAMKSEVIINKERLSGEDKTFILKN